MPGRVLVTAVALAVIFEGVLPFLSPRLFRRSLFSMMQYGDRTLRAVGFGALIAGVVLLYVARFAG